MCSRNMVELVDFPVLEITCLFLVARDRVADSEAPFTDCDLAICMMPESPMWFYPPGGLFSCGKFPLPSRLVL